MAAAAEEADAGQAVEAAAREHRKAAAAEAADACQAVAAAAAS